MDLVMDLSDIAGNLAVGLGVLVAIFQLFSWKDQARKKRRAEVAEHVLVAVADVDDALRFIRNPFDRVPVEEVSDKRRSYSRHYERLVQKNDVFKNLRIAQVSQESVIGLESVTEAINALFAIRNDIAISLEMLSDAVDDDDPETRKMRVDWRRKVYGSYSDGDLLGKQQSDSIAMIKRLLQPVARFED